MSKKLKIEVEIKTSFYYEFKLRMLLFLSYFMDVSTWTENFLQDVEENNKRYVKIKVKESRVTDADSH